MWQTCSKNHELIQFDVIAGQGDCPLCRANELIRKIFWRECWTRYDHVDGIKRYHHGFVSVYEDAQRYLLEAGLIKAEDCAVVD